MKEFLGATFTIAVWVLMIGLPAIGAAYLFSFIIEFAKQRGTPAERGKLAIKGFVFIAAGLVVLILSKYVVYNVLRSESSSKSFSLDHQIHHSV